MSVTRTLSPKADAKAPCAGVSANCGMVAVVAPLRELERMGRENQLRDAGRFGAEAVREFERTKLYLQESLKQVAV